jgi:hypothetical protein
LSPLTRLFVILLVVLSLLLTAATVVFVNQQDDYKRTNEAQKALLAAAQQTMATKTTEADAARAARDEAVRQANAEREQAKQQMNDIQQKAIEKDSQLAQAKTDLAIRSADVTRLAEALKGSEEAKNAQANQINDLRGTNDKLTMQNAQLNQSVTDLTNRLEVTERERKFVSEQLAEEKNKADKQGAMLRDAGISPQQLASATVKGAGAPAINGVIRAIKPIGGIPYATISVGSADSVSKGMQFKVVSRESGDFLGLLTVDTVELNEATGRLEGPKWQQIRPGAEVKTQL